MILLCAIKRHYLLIFMGANCIIIIFCLACMQLAEGLSVSELMETLLQQVSNKSFCDFTSLLDIVITNV